MKALTATIIIAILAGVGCKSARRVQVLPPQPVLMAHHQHLTEAEQQAVRAALPPQEQTLPQPPITSGDNYVSICPYCDTVNLSQTLLRTGGMSITQGQPITVIIRLGVVTNTVAPFNGNLENWNMSYVCSNCREPYSDYRDQLTPKTRSIRLPLRSE